MADARIGRPIDPRYAARDANLREAWAPNVLCKTCANFDGLKGRCEHFGMDISMGMVCDEWELRRG